MSHDQSWDVEKYRSPHEPRWELKSVDDDDDDDEEEEVEVEEEEEDGHNILALCDDCVYKKSDVDRKTKCLPSWHLRFLKMLYFAYSKQIQPKIFFYHFLKKKHWINC